ncbi:MAG: hypothetical protein Q7V62_13860, partial [Actinomycetota bacterium]|nr:hypothetical protein [Actinomycetota bacterium]
AHVLVARQLMERDTSRHRILARGLCHWEWEDATTTTSIHDAFLYTPPAYLRIAVLEYFCGACRPHVDDLLCQLRMETCSHEKRAEIVGLVADVPELIPDLAAIVGEYLFSDPVIVEPPKRLPRIVPIGRRSIGVYCNCDACTVEREDHRASQAYSSPPLRRPEYAGMRLLLPNWTSGQRAAIDAIYGSVDGFVGAYDAALDIFSGAPSTRLRAPPRDDTVRRRHQRLRDFHRTGGLRAKPSRFTRRLARLNDAHMKRIG